MLARTLFGLSVDDPSMEPEAQAFVEQARVGSLATADADGRPHVVPICYALLGGSDPQIVSAVDEKPKSTRNLRRIRDVRENPRVAVLVHRYSEDWSRLGWVQVRGRARVVNPEEDESVHTEAVTALASKYDQYSNHDLDERPVLEIDVDRTLSWGDLEGE